MKYLFLIYLILMPCSYIVNSEIRSSQEFIFQVSSLLLIMAGLLFNNKPLKFNKFNLWLFAMIAWMMFIYLVHMTGWSIVFNACVGLMVYYVAITTLSKEDVRFLIKGICWVATVAIAYFALQLTGYDMRGMQLANVGSAPRVSLFALEATFGAYLAMAIPLLLTLSWVAFALFIPLIFSWSTGAYLGAVSAALIYLWFKKRFIFWITLIPVAIAFVCFVVFIDNPKGMQGTRIPMWKLVIQDSFKKPLVGHGLDSFRNPQKEGYGHYLKQTIDNETVVAVNTDKGIFIKGAMSPEMAVKFQKDGKLFDWWDHPHNEYLWYFYECGLAGLVFFGMFICQLWKRFIKSKMSKETVACFASLAAILIFSLVHFPFHLARLAHLVPIILAMFYISTEEDAVKF